MDFGDVQFGAPLVPPANVGCGALTASDLAEYKRRLGERSPTPMDAMRFADLSMRVQSSLRDTDWNAYNACVQKLKQQQPNNNSRDDEEEAALRQKIAVLERKILTRGAAGRAKIEKRREKKAFLSRVRVRSTGKKGEVGWKIQNSATADDAGDFDFKINFDDGSTDDKWYTREEVVQLCLVCDEDAGNRCSRCEKAYYCGRVCQRSDWPSHKRNCNK